MPREERLLNPGYPVDAFARDLRELRHQAGDPPVKVLARALGCEHSTISAYLNGYRLPPGDRLRAFLAYCKVPAADRAAWDDQLDRARKAVTRFNALMARDEARWRDLESPEENILTADQIKLLLPTNSAAEIIEAVNGLLLEDRGTSALRLIHQVVMAAPPVSVVIEVLEALSGPGHGFYAETFLGEASFRWKSPAALFELLEALRGTINATGNLKIAYTNMGSNPSKQTVAGLLKLLSSGGHRNDILQILVTAAKDHRAQEVSDLLQALREAEQEKTASDLLHRLCEDRSVHFIRDVTIRLRGAGQEGIAENLLEKARSALLGEDHPSVLRAAKGLASALHGRGDSRTAQDLDRQVRVLETRRQALGENHPDTLRSAANLARDLEALGEKLGSE